jgi:hypothetical protein
MRGRFERRSTKRNEGVKALLGELRNVPGRFGRQGAKQAQPNYGGTVGLGVVALAVLTTMAILLLLRRRATRPGGSTEEVHEEVNIDNEEVENEEAAG